MPRALAITDRLNIWHRAQQGEPAAGIAQRLGLSPRTVRNLLAGFRRAGGPTPPAYAACGRDLPAQRQQAQRQACRLRTQHPGWGAGRIRLGLLELPATLAPPPRTLRRWLANAGLAPRPPRRLPAAQRATQPHETWQMDAAERVALATAERVSWLRLADEFTGAVLQSVVFPPGGLGRGAAPGGAGRHAAGLRPLGPASDLEGR